MSENASISDPPPDFDTREFTTKTFSTNAIFWRIYPGGKGYSIFHYKRAAKDRFCDPQRKFGVLYISTSPEGAFMETIGRDFKGVKYANRYIDPEEYIQKRLGKLVPQSTMTLLDLTDPAVPSRLGIDENIWTTPDDETTRQWARAIWEHSTTVDGILYPARHDHTQPSVAVFEEEFPESNFYHPKDQDRPIRKSEMCDQLLNYLNEREIGWADSD